MESSFIDSAELDLILSLDEKYYRLKIVFFDNLIELILYDVIQEQAFDEYLEADEHLDPNERINLFSYFDNKVDYVVERGLLQEDIGETLKTFHALRNMAYHQAFEGNVKKIYFEFADLFSVVALEFITNFWVNFDIPKYEAYIKNNQKIKTDIVSIVKDDLSHRFENLKNDLAFVSDASDSFDEKKHNLTDFQEELDHIVLNYGIMFIEKAKVSRKSKAKHLKLSFAHGWDYIDSNSLSGFNELITVNEIKEWEVKINSINSSTLYPEAIEIWNTINKKLSLLEDILDYYINVAC
jgi:hypothetical protein